MKRRLIKVVELTDHEKTIVFDAQRKVEEAQTELKNLESLIARGHDITEHHFMEWETNFIFDGDFILLYRTSFMKGIPS